MVHDSSFNLKPTGMLNGFPIHPGFFELEGAHPLPGAVNFTVHSSGASSCTLLLYRRKGTEPYAALPFPEDCHIGDVWAMIVYGLDITEFEYAYRLDGPYDPGRGLLFNQKQPLLDIYARAVTGQSEWGKKNTLGFYKARVVKDDFDWGTNTNPKLPMEDLVIYEMHVRGFTRGKDSGVSAPGTFQGIMEKIPYLKDLGVNAVELMPVFEFDEMKDARAYNGKTLIDYWGYNPVSFFAPNTSYAADREYNHEGDELKRLVRELNRNGIECFLDVVFNHTAEGGKGGPVISFKGFDNNIYYMLTPQGDYYNFSGCGNTLNCNHPVVQNLILESLRYWTTQYHVDGFRFDLASILGRDENGAPLANPPLLKMLAYDPVLSDVKLIAEAWDAGGLYQVGSFPAWKRWSEWNGRYRDDMRSFLKGDPWTAQAAAQRITGSRDLYDPAVRGDSASVNFLNCHDGFTLWDMYAYSCKHNEENGWNNTDGGNDNRSWNCGWEGETDQPQVNDLRRRMCRNAMTVLLMSRGVPMFLAGDEFLNTQYGNNNGYCQDNEISWLDWSFLKKNEDFHDFVRYLIHFRKRHPVIRRKLAPCSDESPDIAIRYPDDASRILEVTYSGAQVGEANETGAAAKTADESNADKGSAADDDFASHSGQSARRTDDIVTVLVNTYWEQQGVTLPALPAGMRWVYAVDTALRALPPTGFADPDKTVYAESSGWIFLAPRSVVVLEARAH